MSEDKFEKGQPVYVVDPGKWEHGQDIVSGVYKKKHDRLIVVDFPGKDDVITAGKIFQNREDAVFFIVGKLKKSIKKIQDHIEFLEGSLS